MIKKMEMNKTRNLSIAEYFFIIEKEYLMAEFRKKIYYSPADKIYYKKVMKYKEEKIKNISERNHLDNIFNNSSKLKEIRSELFDDAGKPKFEMNNNDLKNYYSIGNDFSYDGDIWTLKEINEDENLVLRNLNSDKEIEVKKEETSRIL